MSAQRKLSFWEIKNEYQVLLEKLYDEETGEINMEVDAQLNALSTSTHDKCIAIASWVKKMESEKKQIDFMREEIEKRELAYEKQINKQLDHLKLNMESLGIKEVKCPYFTLRIKNNPYSTDILDESLIPNHFINTKTVTTIVSKADKNAIKEMVIKTGIQIPGALVHQKTKLEILMDKI